MQNYSSSDRHGGANRVIGESRQRRTDESTPDILTTRTEQSEVNRAMKTSFRRRN